MAVVTNLMAEENRSKIIISGEKQIKLKKDGTPKMTRSNKKDGVKSEVYAIKRKEDIAAMLDIYDLHIAEATTECSRYKAMRDRLLFKIGTNVGLRIGDLLKTKFSFYMGVDRFGEFYFKDDDYLKPEKTRATGKYVDITFNDSVRRALLEFMEQYPLRSPEDLDKYLFGNNVNAQKPISSTWAWESLKKAAEEAGITYNVGTHSMRKTFGYHLWKDSEDKTYTLVLLQGIFRHTSPAITMAYIGLSKEETAKAFKSLNLGF